MFDIMFSRIILTIGGFAILLMIDVFYFSKKKRNGKLKHKIYEYLIIINTLLCIGEFDVALVFANTSSVVACQLVLKIRYLLDIIYFTFIFFYYYVSINNVQSKSIREYIKNDKFAKMHIIWSLAFSVVFLILPFKDMTKETFTILAGPAFYAIVIYSMISTIETVYVSLKNIKILNGTQKFSTIFLLGLMLIILIFQPLFPEIAIMGIIGVIHVLCLYFIFENPDLELTEEIEVLTRDIQKANRTKSDFLSNMSHEIRSPMNAIVGFSETILNDPEYNKEKVLSDVHHIQASSKNLLDIINNILDISKIESGKDTLEEKEYSIGTIISDLSNLIQARIDTKQIKFVLEVDKEIPSRLYGDATKIYQVLLNILTNAVKYTEVGRIKLSIGKELQGKNVLLKIKVSDTGFGIKKEDYDKVFQKFSRLDSAKTNEIEGTGLGLVITKKYVELMGGKIWFESEYGAGTTFYIELSQPIVNAEAIGDITETKKVEKNSELLDCSGYNILIVDDNKLNLKVAQRLLGAYKFNIDTSTNGKDCIYKFKAGNHYDMIFLDHMMPEMDGIEVLHIIKRLEGYDIPPMIVLTANAINGVREMYLSEGFDEYLSKPIDTSELNRLINKYFNKPKS